MYETLRFNSDYVELTDQEQKEAIEAAIREAKKKKAAVIMQELHWKRTNAPVVYPVLTAREFLDSMIELGNARAADKGWPFGFQMDENNAGIMKALALYFTGDKKFEEVGEGFSLNKGIMLAGGVGCGKTVLMSLCRSNPVASYTQHDCVEIAREYQDKGVSVISSYSGTHRVSDKRWTFGQSEIGRFFDDLGSEENSRNFGNEKNVMAEIIFERYKSVPHKYTHFTTNLDMEMIAQSYGRRVADRLKEMCNVLMFSSEANSRRR